MVQIRETAVANNDSRYDGNEQEVSCEFNGVVSSLSKNISQAGMVCRTSRRVDEMTVLDIRFKLPQKKQLCSTKQWVKCSGVVVRCERRSRENVKLPYEVAIFFDKISDNDKNLLAIYCDQSEMSHS